MCVCVCVCVCVGVGKEGGREVDMIETQKISSLNYWPNYM